MKAFSLASQHFESKEKTPGEVLLSRGFSELSGLCEVSSRLTVSVSFSWQPFSLLA
jgi:hypothetical protein